MKARPKPYETYLLVFTACNTYRCDAQAKPCVVIEQGNGANAMDTVMVDVSTIRSADVAKVMLD